MLNHIKRRPGKTARRKNTTGNMWQSFFKVISRVECVARRGTAQLPNGLFHVSKAHPPPFPQNPPGGIELKELLYPSSIPTHCSHYASSANFGCSAHLQLFGVCAPWRGVHVCKSSWCPQGGLTRRVNYVLQTRASLQQDDIRGLGFWLRSQLLGTESTWSDRKKNTK